MQFYSISLPACDFMKLFLLFTVHYREEFSESCLLIGSVSWRKCSIMPTKPIEINA